MKDLRVVFMGTPEFSVPILQGLIDNCTVIGVVTQPDKEVDRHHKIVFSPVKELAIIHQIPVFQPVKIRAEYEPILALEPDIIITCAYGQIIPVEMLNYPKYACINVHASLLPKLRGGAPIHHAILDNHSKTGITVMYMAEKMDAGDIISQRETTIDFLDTEGTLRDRLSLMGKDLLLETLPLIIEGRVKAIRQNENEVTFGFNIKREEELVTFDREIITIYNHIRGLNPIPGAYALLDNISIKLFASRLGEIIDTNHQVGEIITIYKDGFGVKTLDNKEIIITEIQVSGKKRMLVKDYFNGVKGSTLLGKVFNQN
ncbi:MAG: methionyl-tRNA formyltransferase [Bacilli bacterium]